jgi:hypothetical protein
LDPGGVGGVRPRFHFQSINNALGWSYNTGFLGHGMSLSSTGNKKITCQTDSSNINSSGIAFTGGSGLRFYSHYSNSSVDEEILADTIERMVIDNNGNVGIGTIAPQAPLHINAPDVAFPAAATPTNTGTNWSSPSEELRVNPIRHLQVDDYIKAKGLKKEFFVDLSGPSWLYSRFYPVRISGAAFDYHIHDFIVKGPSTGWGGFPNYNFFEGSAQGGGWGDAGSFCEIKTYQYDAMEFFVYSVCRGSQNDADIYIYLRGGGGDDAPGVYTGMSQQSYQAAGFGKYIIYTTSDKVEIPDNPYIGFTTTDNYGSTFPVLEIFNDPYRDSQYSSSTVELNPAELQRSYSSVHVDDAPGVGHARSMLDSEQAWSAKDGFSGGVATAGVVYATVNLGATYTVKGVDTQKRKYASTQYVTKLKVQTSYTGTPSSWTYVGGGSGTVFDANAAGDTESYRKNITFATPVQARHVRIEVVTYTGYPSMRFGVLASVSEGPIHTASTPRKVDSRCFIAKATAADVAAALTYRVDSSGTTAAADWKAYMDSSGSDMAVNSNLGSWKSYSFSELWNFAKNPRGQTWEAGGKTTSVWNMAAPPKYEYKGELSIVRDNTGYNYHPMYLDSTNGTPVSVAGITSSGAHPKISFDYPENNWTSGAMAHPSDNSASDHTNAFLHASHIGYNETNFIRCAPNGWYEFWLGDLTSGAAEFKISKNGVQTNGAYQNLSDIRIKTEIEEVPDLLALNQVKAIETKYYNYRDPTRTKKYKTIGFIAQEVNDILPNAVNQSDKVIFMDESVNIIRWISNSNDNTNSWDVEIEQIKDFNINHNTTFNLSLKSDNLHNIMDVKVKEIKDNSWILPMDKKYDSIVIKTASLDDIHMINKAMIFALHHGAIQELDKNINKLETNKISRHIESDNRLIKDIEEISTSNALQSVTSIPLKKYNYIDTEKNNGNKHIGFISEDVKTILPESVKLTSQYQPNIMKNYTDLEFTEISTNEYKIAIPYINELDLNVEVLIKGSNTSNNLTHDIKTKVIGLEGGKCIFKLRQKWDNIFLYGALLKDVNSYNKDEIYSYHHGAIQELNKIVEHKDSEIKVLQLKTTSLEEQNIKLKSRLDAIEKHLGAHFFE